MEYFPHLLLIELNLPAKVAPRMHYNREVFFFLTIPMPNKVNHKPFRFLQNFSLSFDEGLISFLELKKHHRKKMDERNSHAISSCTHRCTQHYILCTVYDWTGQRAVMWFNLFGCQALRRKGKLLLEMQFHCF